MMRPRSKLRDRFAIAGLLGYLFTAFFGGLIPGFHLLFIFVISPLYLFTFYLIERYQNSKG